LALLLPNEGIRVAVLGGGDLTAPPLPPPPLSAGKLVLAAAAGEEGSSSLSAAFSIVAKRPFSWRSFEGGFNPDF